MKKVNLLLLLLIFIACTNIPVNKQKKENVKLADKLNVMTFNIRYDNPDDKENNWKFRKDRVANAILFYEADLVGTQEVLHNQLMDLKERLSDFNTVGVGRIDGKTEGEYSAIFYNKKKFTEIKSGYFWLSENPEAVGVKGWDAACERIATWVILKIKNSGKEIFMLNTHFDHVGKVTRRESVNLLLDKVNKLSKGLPVIVTGDFNSTPNSEVIKSLTNKDDRRALVRSKELSPIVYGADYTYHEFGKIPFDQRDIIDYIFVKNNIKVSKYGILAETDRDEFLSDHNPILVKVELK